MAGYLSHTLGCPCSLSERAAIAVLSGDSRFCSDLLDAFRKRRDILFPKIAAIPAIRVEKNAGAFYLWLDIRETGMDDVPFCRALLDCEGVALTPGSAFLCSGFVRLAYTQPTPDLQKAAERLARFVLHSGLRKVRA
jgi:aspartate aminotransferase